MKDSVFGFQFSVFRPAYHLTSGPQTGTNRGIEGLTRSQLVTPKSRSAKVGSRWVCPSIPSYPHSTPTNDQSTRDQGQADQRPIT